MTRHRLTRLVEIVALNVDAIHKPPAQGLPSRIERAEAHMQAICPDGYPGGGSDGPRGSSDTTPTEAAMMARARVASDHAMIESTLKAVNDLLGRVVNLCDAYPGVGHDPAQLSRAHRCSDPVCDELAVKAGMCQRHYMRAWRAKQEGAA